MIWSNHAYLPIAAVSITLALSVGPAKAALVEINFAAESANVGGPAGAPIDLLFALFPFGTPSFGRLVLDYDGNPDTASIASLDFMLGANSFSMPDTADQTVEIRNDFSELLSTYDLVRARALAIDGPTYFGGLTVRNFVFQVDDTTTSIFDSDTPSPEELTGISELTSGFVSVGFENAAGEFAGRIGLTVTDPLSVQVISPVPLPGAFGLAMLGLGGLVAVSRRRKPRS